MENKVCLVIPVRLASERFPNKPLELFQGKSLIQNSIDIALKLDFIDNIVLASSENSFEVESICMDNMIEYLYIKEPVSCGTEKVHYVQKAFPGYTHYMTLPVDEPTISSEELNRVWREKTFTSDKIKETFNTNCLYTFYCDFYNEGDLLSNKSCKLVTKNERVFYTSRAVIPGNKNPGLHDLSVYKKHVGVFVFHKSYLKSNLWKENSFATLEGLEQNMFIGFNLKAYKIHHIGFGIDTPDQIPLLEERISLLS